MAKGSKLGLAIIGSVLITLILVAAGGYFVLPLVFPNLNAENDESNIVLQSYLVEFDNQAERNDTISDFEVMNGTQMSITIKNESRIAVSFSCNFLLQLDSIMLGSLWFEISLVIEGVSNSTGSIIYFRESASGDMEFYSKCFNINLMSNALNNGTYNIAVYWRSLEDVAGLNGLMTNLPSVNNLRTLWVQELR